VDAVTETARTPAPEPVAHGVAVSAVLALVGWVAFLAADEGGLFFGAFALALVALGYFGARRFVLYLALGVTLLGFGLAPLMPGDHEGFNRIDVARALFYVAFPVLVPTAAGMMLRRVFKPA
jgi:hypothetical protein